MPQLSRRSIQAIGLGGAALLLAGRAWQGAVAHTENTKDQTMKSTVAVDPSIVTLVTVLTVDPANQPKLLGLLRDNSKNVISTLKGWISTILVASKDKRRIVIYSQWKSVADIEGMRTDSRMVAYFPQIAALAALESIVAEVDTVISADH
jgi:quinol monooxygenase YgiN